MRRALAALAVLALVACSGDSNLTAAPDGDGPSTDTTTVPDTAPFVGDPDSEFCARTRASAAEPAADPFEPDIEPAEVEARFRALRRRVEGLAEVAPPELEADLALLTTSLGELADRLEDAAFDFDVLAESDADLSVADDPALAVIAVELPRYQRQVCGVG